MKQDGGGIDYDPEDLKEDLTLEENKSNEVSTVTPIPLNEIQEKVIDAYIRGMKGKMTNKEYKYWGQVAMGTHSKFPYNKLFES